MHRFLLVACAALAGCTTQTLERNQMGIFDPADANGRPAREEAPRRRDEPQPEAPPESATRKTVTIPPEAAAKAEEFATRGSTLFADAVDVDLSRDPWLGRATFSISRDAISRRDEKDDRRGVLIITLERRQGVAPAADSVPTVRFGDGLRIVGVDRVVLRFWSQQREDRPSWFQALGAGKKAVYAIDAEPTKRWQGQSVTLRGELHRVADTYRFDWSAEARP